MNIKFYPSHLYGDIYPPISKSYAHRYLLSALLSEEKTQLVLNNLCNDVKETIEIIKAFGKKVNYHNFLLEIEGKIKQSDQIEFNVLESGSTLRFIIPIAMCFFNKTIIHCSKRLIQRGISIYIELFKDKNVDIQIVNEDIIINGKLTPGQYSLLGNVSSQFISGLLFALPLLNKPSSIEIKGEIESKNYIDMTIDVLKKSSVNIKNKNNTYFIKPSLYKCPNTTIEKDYSNAAFLDAFNIDKNNKVNVLGLSKKSIQGDKIYQKCFIDLQNNKVIDLKNCIDLGPVLFVVASILNGGTFINTNRLKIKESDRLEAMKNELNKFNIKMEILDNSCIIHPSNIISPQQALNTYNDHRIAMALSILANKFGAVINDFNVIKKSYPNYLNDLISLHAKIEIL